MNTRSEQQGDVLGNVIFIAITNSQQLLMSTLCWHRNGPADNQHVRRRASGASVLTAELVAADKLGKICSYCLPLHTYGWWPHQAPVDCSNSMVTQRALGKVNGPQNNQRHEPHKGT